MNVFRRFGSDQTGTTAMMFGLTLFPLMAALGGAVDYGRATAIHTKLQRAIDMAAVTLVKEPATTSAADLQVRAAKLVGDMMGAQDFYKVGTVTVSRGSSNVTVAAGASVQNAFMQLFGFKTTDVGASAVSTWGTQKIELALVLDNTGSMRETIGGQRKIDALKSSALKLLSGLRDKATGTDTVKVSIVPFDTEVRLDASLYRNADWIRWNNPNSTSERNAWPGYVVDRYAPYDVSDAVPAMVILNSLYPKLATSEWAASGDLATLRPLTSLFDKASYDAVVASITAMQPRGNTNVGLGVSWGTATLTRSVPLGVPLNSDPSSVKKFMVVLTDGTNTEKSVNGTRMYVANPNNPSPTDPVSILMNARTAAACETAKNPGGAAIEVFTIRLLAGDASLLSGCASGPTPLASQHYFDVQNAADLANAFQAIYNAISGTRLSS